MRPSKSVLRKLRKNYTNSEIAKKYKVTPACVSNWARYYKLPLNDHYGPGNSFLVKNNIEIEDVRRDVEKYSLQIVAEKFGVSRQAIQYFCRRYGIDTTGRGKQRKTKPFIEIPKEELEILINKIPITEIAKKYKVSAKVIYANMGRYGINLKGHGFWSKERGAKISKEQLISDRATMTLQEISNKYHLSIPRICQISKNYGLSKRKRLR